MSRPVLRDHPAGPGPGQGCCRRDGHITRIEEYLDSGQRAMIKAARDALTS